MDFTTPTQLQNLQNLNVVRPGQVEALNEPLYDFGTYAAAGQTQLAFFATPRGQSGKTYGDTNMELAGSLSAGNQFEVRAIEIAFFPGVAIAGVAAPATVPEFADDVYKVYSSSAWIEINVLNKTYQRIPLCLAPPSTRENINAALSDTTTAGAGQRTAINYAAWCGPVFQVTPFQILNNMNFGVTLNWSAAVPLPSGQAGRIGVILRGIKYRNSQ